MELFLKSDGRYSFEKEKKPIVITIDEGYEKRKSLAKLLEKVLPSLEKVDRLIRDVGAEVTKKRVIFFFKIRSRFYQVVLPAEDCTDEATIKKKFTYILRRELRDLRWVR